MLFAGLLLGVLFYPEDGDSTVLRNVGLIFQTVVEEV
jgi:hypothetical protein